MKKRVHAYYAGTVQGVGFRFTAERAARELGIVGWVRNLRDGRVEILVEGDESLLKDFLAKIKKRMGYYIRDTDIELREPTGEFSDFEIAFS
jgi:acylphosphatase